ncbi:TPA: hypothetical protein DIC62_00320 [Candidatus Nomurabacteria bacterium]|nr:hypothetical protein [Candidatus Nomurabacteria bacterium]
MPKRIDTDFSSQLTDCFIDLMNPKHGILSYMNSAKECHKLWGGKQYYYSCSGLSGSGYLEESVGLLKLGCYRPGYSQGYACWLEKPILLYSIESEGVPEGTEVPVQILIPVLNNGIIQLDKPTIIRVGEACLIFCRTHQDYIVKILDAVRKGNFDRVAGLTGEVKTIKMSAFHPETLQEAELTVQVYGHNLGRGINYVKFLDVRDLQVCKRQEEGGWRSTVESISSTHTRLGVYEHESNHFVYVQDGFIQKILGDDPLYDADKFKEFYSGKGFSLIKHGVVSQLLPDNKVWLGCALWKSDLLEVAPVDVQMQLDNCYDYELELDQLDFCLNHKEYCQKVEDLAKSKFKTDLKVVQKKHKIDMAVESLNPEMVVTLEDSMKSGNCQVGTKNWADRNFPNRETLTVAELLPHKKDSNVLRVLRYLAIKSNKELDVEETE